MTNTTLNTSNYPNKGLINHSYERLTRFVLNHLSNIKTPDIIIEFGPGYSTQLLMELSPKSPIFTCENDPVWYDKAKAMFEYNKNIVPIFIDKNDEGNSIVQHLNIINKNITKTKRTLSLMFIDGCDRKHCYSIALNKIKLNSPINPDTIIFHDAQWFFKIIDEPTLGNTDTYKENWKYYIDDSTKFNKTQNLGCVTLALSNKYNFNEWYDYDLKNNLINSYNEL